MRLLPLVAAVACRGEVGCEGQEPSLTLGTGLSAYEDTPPGADVTLVAGPQGGFHVELAFAATGLGALDRLLTTVVGTVDDVVVVEDRAFPTFRCDPEEGRYEAWGWRLVFAPTVLELPAVADRDAIVRATLVVPESGERWDATTTFRLLAPPEVP